MGGIRNERKRHEDVPRSEEAHEKERPEARRT